MDQKVINEVACHVSSEILKFNENVTNSSPDALLMTVDVFTDCWTFLGTQ